MSTPLIATFRSEKRDALADGEQLVVEREGDELVARRVPELDSDEPIRSFSELAASAKAAAERKLREQ